MLNTLFGLIKHRCSSFVGCRTAHYTYCVPEWVEWKSVSWQSWIKVFTFRSNYDWWIDRTVAFPHSHDSRSPEVAGAGMGAGSADTIYYYILQQPIIKIHLSPLLYYPPFLNIRRLWYRGIMVLGPGPHLANDLSIELNNP